FEVADNLGFYNDYDTALATAKKSDRILVLIVLKDPCPYCDRLANNTLSDTNVEKALKDFVPVVVDINDDYPKGFRPAMTPVTMFVNPQTEDLLWESMGAVNAKTFQSDLKEATLSRQEDEAAH
ncbi:MAG TPA: thioredoxin family protein, partial [Helicobacteraceae bacterium]|nr:thioredoxin family protein [Helicobacteraceae bacterium]